MILLPYVLEKRRSLRFSIDEGLHSSFENPLPGFTLSNPRYLYTGINHLSFEWNKSYSS